MFALGEVGRETGRLGFGLLEAKSDQRPPSKLTRFRGCSMAGGAAGQPKAAETSEDGAGRRLSKEAIEEGRADTVVSKSLPGSIGSKLGLKWLKPEQIGRAHV